MNKNCFNCLLSCEETHSICGSSFSLEFQNHHRIDDSLSKVFKKFGAVEETEIVCERDTGRSRGFGFVTFETDESALAAQKAMNGQEMDGRPQ